MIASQSSCWNTNHAGRRARSRRLRVFALGPQFQLREGVIATAMRLTAKVEENSVCCFSIE